MGLIKSPPVYLSPLTREALKNHKLLSRAICARMMLDDPHKLQAIPGVGQKGIADIQAWLGLDQKPLEPLQEICTCTAECGDCPDVIAGQARGCASLQRLQRFKASERAGQAICFSLDMDEATALRQLVRLRELCGIVLEDLDRNGKRASPRAMAALDAIGLELKP